MSWVKAVNVCLAVVCLGATGCSYDGQDSGSPWVRKFRWISYVAGDDIKSSCAVGGPDRLRFVYNARYEEQVRSYDWSADTGILKQMATLPSQGSLNKLSIEDPLEPWRAAKADIVLNADQSRRLVDAAAQEKGFGPPAIGLSLQSDEFFWTLAACRQGHYSFTGWAGKPDQLNKLAFATVLFATDKIDVPIEKAREIAPDPTREAERRLGHVTDFTLEVGADGLVK